MPGIAQDFRSVADAARKICDMRSRRDTLRRELISCNMIAPNAIKARRDLPLARDNHGLAVGALLGECSRAEIAMQPTEVVPVLMASTVTYRFMPR